MSALFREHTVEFAKLTFSTAIPAETLLRVIKKSVVFRYAVHSLSYDRKEQRELRADARDRSELRHQQG
jgi:hypothetical protein